MKIIEHPNYNPRIIEHITSVKFMNRNTPKDYQEAILRTLNNPEDVWHDEYYNRLLNIDRILLNTLFSLTDTLIEMDVLKYCFNYRLSTMSNVDTTIDHFTTSIKRLNQSLIKIVDNKGEKVGVVNPSVNDFLNNQINRNNAELKSIKENVAHTSQVIKMFSPKSEDYIEKEVKDKRILNYYFNDMNEMLSLIVSQICRGEIFDISYKNYIDEFLSTNFRNSYGSIFIKSNTEILNTLFSQRFIKFYTLDYYLRSIDNIKSIIKYLYIGDLIETINVLHACILKLDITYSKDINKIFAERIEEELNSLPYDDELSEYLSNYNIHEIVYNKTKTMYGDFDMNDVINEIETLLTNDLQQEVCQLAVDLPVTIKDLINFDSLEFNISLFDIKSYVEDFLSCDDYDEDQYREDYLEVNGSEIESIFER